MKTRKLFVALSLLVVAGLVLAGCAQPTPTPAPKPAAKVEPTKAPAATQAPAATKAPEVKINNPPKTAEEVDAIKLKGKNVTVQIGRAHV